MTLILELAPDEQFLLESQAHDAGLSSQDYARRVLLGDEAQVARRLKQRRGIALLEKWLDEAQAIPESGAQQDDEEWRATMRDLDEQRGGRRLFGEEVSLRNKTDVGDLPRLAPAASWNSITI